MSKAYLGLGSNLGDRRASLEEALRRLGEDGRVTLVRVSSIYASAAVGVTDQPDFLNLVAEVHTQLRARALLDHALAVEASLGRVRDQRWGPRTIDIDLLWFDGVSLEEDGLVLPHPRLQERAFVLVPWQEIAAGLVIGDRTVDALAAAVDVSAVRRIGSCTTEGKAP